MVLGFGCARSCHLLHFGSVHAIVGLLGKVGVGSVPSQLQVFLCEGLSGFWPTIGYRVRCVTFW